MRKALLLVLFVGLVSVLMASISLAQPCSVCTPTPIPPTSTPSRQPDATPVPDADGDGSPDITDNCPNVQGPNWNNGCPAEEDDGSDTDDQSTAEQPQYIAPVIPESVPVCAVATTGAQGVNIRDQPSAESNVIGILNPSLIYNRIFTVANPEGNWSLVQTESLFGWVRSDLLRTGGLGCSLVPGLSSNDDTEAGLLLPAVQAARESGRLSAVDPQPNSIVYLFDELTGIPLGAVMVDEDGNQFEIPDLFINNPDAPQIPKAVLYGRKSGDDRRDYYVIVELDLDFSLDTGATFAYDPGFVGGVNVAVAGDTEIVPGPGIIADVPEDNDSDMKIELENVLISSYQPAGGSPVDEIDELSLATGDGSVVIDYLPDGGFVIGLPGDEPTVPGPQIVLALPTDQPVIGFVGAGGMSIKIPDPAKPVYPTYCETLAENPSEKQFIKDGYPVINYGFAGLKAGDQLSITIDINNLNLPEGTTHVVALEWRKWYDPQPNNETAELTSETLLIADPQNTPATFTITVGDYVDEPGYFSLGAVPVWLSEAPDAKVFLNSTLDCVPGN